jgi:hypothetical protein
MRDGSLLLTWAGLDHRQRADVLVAVIADRVEQGWGAAQLAPLLAGLAELLPWVAQWHGEVDPAFGQRPAEAYQGFLDATAAGLGLTGGDLAAWRPPAPRRGRKS